jgi:hypothetical protein
VSPKKALTGLLQAFLAFANVHQTINHQCSAECVENLE